MRKTILSLYLVNILGAFLLTSCASIPKPKNSEDTLLIVPVSFSSPSNVPWGYYYQLRFEGVSQSLTISPTAAHYVAFPGLPPGDYLLTRIASVPLASSYAGGQAAVSSFKGIPITVVANTITMAPFLLGAEMLEVKEKPGYWSQSFNLKLLEDERREMIRDELSKAGAFDDWLDGITK